MLTELTVIAVAFAFIAAVLGFGTLAVGIGAIAGYLLILFLVEMMTGWPSQPHISHHWRNGL